MLGEVFELVSDQQLNEVWGNANFGSVGRREMIRDTLLKVACGYHSGHTAMSIVTELGLVSGYQVAKKVPRLTKLGGRYLWAAIEGKNTP